MSVCGCSGTRARINGRTLGANLKQYQSEPHPFGPFGRTSWVEVCPSCHARWLRIDEEHSLPYLDANDLMRTAADAMPLAPAVEIDFAGFRFTWSALRSAIALQALEFGTAAMEARGASLPAMLSEAQAAEFSEAVCRWGGGARVWGKLKSGNNGDPGPRLAAWLNAVKAGELGDELAIAHGRSIPGLGVSFASKHLRMLQPARFAVLDEVLCEGFGFALNGRGYRFFLRELRTLQGSLQQRFGQAFTVATLEAGLFMLVRQGVRARADG